MMQTRTARVHNPLGLPIEWRTHIEPYHGAHDAARLAELVASMQNHGWQGPPIVCSRALFEAGQDRAYTGSHRLRAWQTAQDDPQATAPCVFIEDLTQAFGIDFEALLDELGGFEDEAVTAAACQIPAEITDAYGLDTGGI